MQWLTQVCMWQTRVQHGRRTSYRTHEHREAISPRWYIEMERQNRHHRFGDVPRYCHITPTGITAPGPAATGDDTTHTRHLISIHLSFHVAARRTFNVDPDTHIDSLEQAEQITIEGTSKWSCKIAITGLPWSFAATNRTLAVLKLLDKISSPVFYTPYFFEICYSIFHSFQKTFFPNSLLN